MYDLARSCQELQEKCQIFTTEKKRFKRFLVQKTSPENPRNAGKHTREELYISCQEIRENQEQAGKSERSHDSRLHRIPSERNPNHNPS